MNAYMHNAIEAKAAHFPEMQAQSKGRDVVEDIGAALDKVCDQDSNSEAVHLARVAQIVR